VYQAIVKQNQKARADPSRGRPAAPCQPISAPHATVLQPHGELLCSRRNGCPAASQEIAIKKVLQDKRFKVRAVPARARVLSPEARRRPAV
tara:strand:- start:1397 stop:1669 length:273 start_codon:yes stop_codon:yes gene_type:complete